MSRGRKSNAKVLGQNWESLYNRNSGFYFKILLKELGKLNVCGNDSALDLYEELKTENKIETKQISPIQTAEVPFLIPKNWKWCRLNEIGVSTIGIIFKPSQVGKTGIPVLRANNVQNNKIDYSDLINVDTIVRDKQMAKVGDILICVRSGSNNLIGKSAIIEKDGMSFGAFMALFRSRINSYVHSFMTSDLFKSQIDDKKSTGINQLTQSTLNNILIPLPPISEQKNILKFFEAFENEGFIPEGYYFNIEVEKKIFNLHKSQIKASILRGELSNQLTQLSNLNQAILQEAVQGKLVAQDPNDEPASELLKRIKADKLSRVGLKPNLKKKNNVLALKDEATQGEATKGEATKGEATKGEATQGGATQSEGTKEGASIKPSEIPFEIPESWVWCRLGEIIYDTEGGKSPNCLHENVKGDDWGVIKTTALQQMFFLENENKILPKNYIVSEQHKVFEDDVLITRAGPQNRVGVVCCVTNLSLNLILSDKTIRFKHPKQFIYSKYLATVYNSPLMKPIISSKMVGMAESQVNISQESMKNFLFPLPPLPEQKRIVVKIEKQLAKTKQLKEQVEANQQATEQLLKALLHQAFGVEE